MKIQLSLIVGNLLKEAEDEILKQFTALNERIDRNAQDINKGIVHKIFNAIE